MVLLQKYVLDRRVLFGIDIEFFCAKCQLKCILIFFFFYISVV